MRVSTLTGALALIGISAACSSSGSNATAQQAAAAPPSEDGPPIDLPITRQDLPSSGLCRVFVVRSGRIEDSNDFSCNNIEFSAPLGSYVLMRSKQNRQEVYLCYMSRSEPGVLDGIDVFNTSRLRLIRVVMPRGRRTSEDTMKCVDAEGK